MAPDKKKNMVKAGKKTGTFKIKNGLIDCTWKENRYTHLDFTGGQANKNELI